MNREGYEMKNRIEAKINNMSFFETSDIIKDITAIRKQMQETKDEILLLEEEDDTVNNNTLKFLKFILDEEIVDTTTLLKIINTLYEEQGKRKEKLDITVLNTPASKSDFQSPFKWAIKSYYKKQKGIEKVEQKLKQVLEYIIKSSDYYNEKKNSGMALKKYVNVTSKLLSPKFYKSSMSLKTFLEEFKKMQISKKGGLGSENLDKHYIEAIYALKQGVLDGDYEFKRLFTELEVETANTDKLDDIYRHLSDSYIYAVRTLSDHLHNNFKKYSNDFENISKKRHKSIMNHVNNLMEKLYQSKGNHKIPDVVKNAKSIKELHSIIMKIPLNNEMYEEYVAALIKFSVYVLGFGIHTEREMNDLKSKAKKFEKQVSNVYIKIPKKYYTIYSLDDSTGYNYLVANEELLGEENEYSELTEEEKFIRLIEDRRSIILADAAFGNVKGNQSMINKLFAKPNKLSSNIKDKIRGMFVIHLSKEQQLKLKNIIIKYKEEIRNVNNMTDEVLNDILDRFSYEIDWILDKMYRAYAMLYAVGMETDQKRDFKLALLGGSNPASGNERIGINAVERFKLEDEHKSIDVELQINLEMLTKEESEKDHDEYAENKMRIIADKFINKRFGHFLYNQALMIKNRFSVVSGDDREFIYKKEDFDPEKLPVGPIDFRGIYSFVESLSSKENKDEILSIFKYNEYITVIDALYKLKKEPYINYILIKIPSENGLWRYKTFNMQDKDNWPDDVKMHFNDGRYVNIGAMLDSKVRMASYNLEKVALLENLVNVSNYLLLSKWENDKNRDDNEKIIKLSEFLLDLTRKKNRTKRNSIKREMQLYLKDTFKFRNITKTQAINIAKRLCKDIKVINKTKSKK